MHSTAGRRAGAGARAYRRPPPRERPRPREGAARTTQPLLARSSFTGGPSSARSSSSWGRRRGRDRPAARGPRRDDRARGARERRARTWAKRAHVTDVRIAAVMLLDAAVLTVLLDLTGGASNPFSTLYLVNVALAAVLLPPRWSWLLMAASLARVRVALRPRAGDLAVAPHPHADEPRRAHGRAPARHVDRVRARGGVHRLLRAAGVARARGARARAAAGAGAGDPPREARLPRDARRRRRARALDAALDDRGRREGAPAVALGPVSSEVRTTSSSCASRSAAAATSSTGCARTPERTPGAPRADDGVGLDRGVARGARRTRARGRGGSIATRSRPSSSARRARSPTRCAAAQERPPGLGARRSRGAQRVAEDGRVRIASRTAAAA